MLSCVLQYAAVMLPLYVRISSVLCCKVPDGFGEQESFGDCEFILTKLGLMSEMGNLQDCG